MSSTEVRNQHSAVVEHGGAAKVRRDKAAAARKQSKNLKVSTDDTAWHTHLS